MNILDKIVLRKKEEIALAKTATSIKDLERGLHFNRTPYALKEFLLAEDRNGIIAEFKRRSPSKGIINNHSAVTQVTTGYAAAGASALSVLTDVDFFCGHKNDLLEARAANTIPVLRKDFMIDEYQIIESKALGADIILLIAAILTPKEIDNFSRLAKDLGLNVLLEVHSLEELQRSVNPYIDAIGVNNRNLVDFSVDIQTSFTLAEEIPTQILKISESGISDIQTIKQLKLAGFNGFLIGENFMKMANPVVAMQAFTEELISV